MSLRALTTAPLHVKNLIRQIYEEYVLGRGRHIIYNISQIMWAPGSYIYVFGIPELIPHGKPVKIKLTT